MSNNWKNPPEMAEPSVGTKASTCGISDHDGVKMRRSRCGPSWSSTDDLWPLEEEPRAAAVLLEDNVVGKTRSETQPPAAVHRRSVRSRESVHMWPMSVGCGCDVTETISDPPEIDG